MMIQAQYSNSFIPHTDAKWMFWENCVDIIRSYQQPYYSFCRIDESLSSKVKCSNHLPISLSRDHEGNWSENVMYYCVFKYTFCMTKVKNWSVYNYGTIQSMISLNCNQSNMPWLRVGEDAITQFVIFSINHESNQNKYNCQIFWQMDLFLHGSASIYIPSK